MEVLALRKRYDRAGRCVLCGLTIFASSHQSTHGFGHEWEHLNDKELIEFASKKRKLTTPRAKGHDFLIDFGQHSGKYLSQVLRDEPGWVVWLLEDAPGIYKERPAMHRALVSMGCLTEVDGVDQMVPTLLRPFHRPRPERTLQHEHHC